MKTEVYSWRVSARKPPIKCGAGALAREKPGISAGVFAHRVVVQSFPRINEQPVHPPRLPPMELAAVALLA
jgi:hypothetical protein